MGEYEKESVPVLSREEVTEDTLASSKSLECETTNKVCTKSNFNSVIRIYVFMV
jgi:hypothetical protein